MSTAEPPGETIGPGPAILLCPTQGPCSKSNGQREHHHAHVAHALERCPPLLEGGSHTLAQHHQHKSRGETSHEAVGVGPQRG